MAVEVGVHDGERRRQLGPGQVVVRDDHVDAQRRRARDGGERGDAVVHGDGDLYAVGREALDGLDAQAVAVAFAIRDRPHDVGVCEAQEAHEDRRPGHAVHVVVAAHGDALAVENSPRQAFRSRNRVGETFGRVEVGQAGA